MTKADFKKIEQEFIHAEKKLFNRETLYKNEQNNVNRISKKKKGKVPQDVLNVLETMRAKYVEAKSDHAAKKRVYSQAQKAFAKIDQLYVKESIKRSNEVIIGRNAQKALRNQADRLVAKYPDNKDIQFVVKRLEKYGDKIPSVQELTEMNNALRGADVDERKKAAESSASKTLDKKEELKKKEIQKQVAAIEAIKDPLQRFARGLKVVEFGGEKRVEDINVQDAVELLGSGLESNMDGLLDNQAVILNSIIAKYPDLSDSASRQKIIGEVQKMTDARDQLKKVAEDAVANIENNKVKEETINKLVNQGLMKITDSTHNAKNSKADFGKAKTAYVNEAKKLAQERSKKYQDALKNADSIAKKLRPGLIDMLVKRHRVHVSKAGPFIDSIIDRIKKSDDPGKMDELQAEVLKVVREKLKALNQKDSGEVNKFLQLAEFKGQEDAAKRAFHKYGSFENYKKVMAKTEDKMFSGERLGDGNVEKLAKDYNMSEDQKKDLANTAENHGPASEEVYKKATGVGIAQRLLSEIEKYTTGYGLSKADSDAILSGIKSGDLDRQKAIEMIAEAKGRMDQFRASVNSEVSDPAQKEAILNIAVTRSIQEAEAEKQKVLAAINAASQEDAA